MKAKVIFQSVLVAAVCLTAAAMTACDDDEPSTKVLKTNPSALAVAPKYAATATVSGGTSPYTASSSNAEIATATVQGATLTVTGVKEGTASITITDKNKLTGSLAVKVTATATPLSFENESLSVPVGKDMTTTVKNGVAPYTASVKDAKVASATVKDKAVTVKGIKAGTTTVTVTDKNKAQGTITITVK